MLNLDAFDKENVFGTPPTVAPYALFDCTEPAASPERTRLSHRLHPRYRSPLSPSPMQPTLRGDWGGQSKTLAAAHTFSPPLSGPCGLDVNSPATLALSLQEARGSHEDTASNRAEVVIVPSYLDLIPELSSIPITTSGDTIAAGAPVSAPTDEGAADIELLAAMDETRTPRAEQPGQGGTTIPDQPSTLTAFPELLGGDLPWEIDNTNDLYHAAGLPARVLDEEYLTSCRFYHHDPRRPLPTNLDILFRMGNHFGQGATRSELRQALRRCRACRRFMYADARGYHRCNSAPLSVDSGKDLVSALLSHEESSGFASQDLRSYLSMCGLCDRVLQSNVLAYHQCD
ncbi:hypothetical protein NMY22_g18790 [Coprinellus aureogranulatus]|nr:hypothetical protein NMY22_g18790 [Coprinellus aureogranulatus]